MCAPDEPCTHALSWDHYGGECTECYSSAQARQAALDYTEKKKTGLPACHYCPGIKCQKSFSSGHVHHDDCYFNPLHGYG